MILDLHVHICALTPEHGLTSRSLLSSVGFRFMRWRLGIMALDADAENRLVRKLATTIAETEKLDAAVILAFDAVHDDEGRLDLSQTHLYAKNDFILDLSSKNPQMLFAASVHPYRKDAAAELERCIAAGAVLMKWLPLTQRFDPSDRRCLPLYEMMAHYKLPLLSHTGFENALPTLLPHTADPALLLPALQRGVTVIMAHCGTRAKPGQQSYLDTFTRLALDHEHCYGDTSALNLPTRDYAWRTLLADDRIRKKLVHGSDWPIISLPPFRQMCPMDSARVMLESNWMRRDVLIKQSLGLDEEYWRRGGRLIRRG